MKVISRRLKKGALLALAFCVLLSAVGATGIALAEDSNLVKNPSFEGSSPNPANYVSDSKTAFSSEQAHTGERSLKVTKDAQNGLAQIPVKLTANKNYEFSAWVRLSSGELDKKSFSAYYVNGGIRQLIAQTSVMMDGNDDWAQLQGIFYCATSGDCTIQITLDDYLAGGEYYIDDVVVAETVAPKIVSSDPANGAANLPLSKIDEQTQEEKPFDTVTIEFDSPIDPATITRNNIYFEGMDGFEYNVEPNGEKGCKITGFTLEAGGVYIIALENIKDTSGNVMPKRTVSFTTIEPPPVNIIDNGDFEDPNATSNFATYRGNFTISDKYFRKKNPDDEGETGHSLRFETVKTGDNGPQHASLQLKLPSGAGIARTYRFSVWYLTDSEHQYNGTHRLFLTYDYIVGAGPSGGTIGIKQSDYFKGDGQWYEYSGVITVPAIHNNNVVGEITKFNLLDDGTVEEVVPGTKNWKNGVVYLDDIVIEPMRVTQLEFPTSSGITNFGVNGPLVLKMNMGSDGATPPAVTINGSADLVNGVVPVPGSHNGLFYVYFKEALEYDTEYNIDVTNPTASFTIKTPKRLSVSSVTPSSGSTPPLGDVTVRASGIANNTAQDLPLTLVALLYKDGKLINMSTSTMTVPAKTYHPSDLTTVINVPSDGCTLRVFVIDNFTSGQIVWK